MSEPPFDVDEMLRQRSRPEPSREWLLLAERMLEAERRLLHMATSNADDWRWYQNQARQACRALGIVKPELQWSDE